MLNVLITGSNGQLGLEFRELFFKFQYNFFFTDKEDLDITSKEQVEIFINEKKIDVIINCAAYTAVDKAEEFFDDASLVNYKAVENMATIAKYKNIKLIHISTDYVFDGKQHRPYIENDKTLPASAYGKTKLLGEDSIVKINPLDSIIIRTSWLYSSFGENFVKTILKLGKTKESIDVVFDQIGTPTYAKDLAFTILNILPNIKNKKVQIYHYSNEGVLSWYDFAKEIMKMAKLSCAVYPVHSTDFKRAAPRPYFSVLDKTKIKREFNIQIPYWKDSLDDCLKKMGERE